MITPPSTAIVRYDLSMRRNDWDQVSNRKKYIGLRVMPAAPVQKPSSNFTRLGLASTFVPVEDTTRNPRGAYKRDEFGWLQDSYTTQEHGWEAPVDDAEIEMYGDFLPVEQVSSMRVTDRLLAFHEQTVANAVFNSAVYSGNQTIALVTPSTGVNGTRFQDYVTAAPIDTILQAKWQCRLFGVEANALVIPQIGLDRLRRCQQIIDQLKYSGVDDPKKITNAQLAELFQLENILVGDGFKNLDPSGVTPSFGRFWNPTMCWVGRIADQDSNLTDPSICVGRTVMYVGQNAQIPGIGDQDAEPAIIMEEYREEARRGGVIRGRWNWEVKPFDDPLADGNFYRAGVLITNVTDGSTI